MALKRTQNKSKRDRLEDARGQLREIFEVVPAEAAEKERPEEILAKAWELAEDIERFGRKYLAHFMVDQETGEFVPPAEFHKELYQLLLTEQRVAVAAPREHAKSTVVNVFFVLYCICYKLRRFIVIISDTEAQAILQVAGVKEELETNAALRTDFGDLVGDKKWGDKDIRTTTGIQLSARGAGQSLRGLRYRFNRPDLVICDDLENDESVDSPDQRLKLKNWFVRAVLNLGKNCQVVDIGTILHYDSLLAELVDPEKFPLFKKRTFEAVDEDWNPESVLWPEKWSLAELQKKESDIGSVDFDQEFRNRPINKETQVFKEEWFLQHQYHAADLRDLVSVKVTGIDPAISTKAKADFFGSVTVAIDEKGFLYVTRAEQKKFPFPEQVKYVCSKFDEEQPLAIGIETVAYQKALKQRLDEVSRETNRYMRIVEIKADGDKFQRISTLSPLVENGTLRFRMDGSQKNLIAQLLYLGKLKDDLADALEIAVRVAKEVRGMRAALASVDLGRENYAGTRRGIMSEIANNQIARDRGEEDQPVMTSERRSIWR
jgi:phage terminase large subunit-like protein